MIKEIIIDGEVLTANHWFDLGLPSCLHDCLDGTQWLYQDSRIFFFDEDSFGERRALEKIFRFPKIEDTLEPLKLYFFEYWKRQNEVDLREGISVNGWGCDFLQTLLVEICWALEPSPLLNMTQKKIDKILDDATQAVHVIKNNPLRENYQLGDPFSLIYRVIKRKFYTHGNSATLEDLTKVTELLSYLKEHLEATGMSFSLGELLDYWVKGLPTKQLRGVLRPGRGEAEKRYFCVALADQFGCWAENCLYREVAILTTAVFSETSEDYVRKAHKRAQT